MSNLRKYWAVTKVNFKTNRLAYLVTGFCLLAGIANAVVQIAFHLSDSTVSPSNYLYLLCVLMPIFVASGNYTRFRNIGVRKNIFLWGSAINYIILSVFVSLVCVAEFYLFDKNFSVYNLVNVFNWDTNIFTAFFSSFSFLLLFQVIIHTLTFMQTKWYGWVADLVIIAIISIFTPIAPLRQVEIFFFDLIIFVKPAIIQIAVCLGLSVAFYLTNSFYLKNRN
ncbi:MAG: hypothetical protein Q4C00_03370 [Bacillota bacterium]|nr:hypothetical protein [Bacillota bacterium]